MPQHIALVVRRAIPDGPGTRRLVLRDPDGVRARVLAAYRMRMTQLG